MTWYLYAFAAGIPVGLPRGVGGRPVFAATERDITLLVSRWDDQPAPRLTGTTVLAHEGVVEAAMREFAVLPCRFGTVVDHAYCLEFLVTHSDAILARLENVSGQVEVTVKGFDRNERNRGERDAPRSGTVYLLRKQVSIHQAEARIQRARRLAAEIDSVLSPWATDRSHQVTPTRNVLVAMTYLIPAAATKAWANAAGSLRDRFPDHDFLATGPWPPYHFSEVTTSGGRTDEPNPGVHRQR